jgi:hypothetical protein
MMDNQGTKHTKAFLTEQQCKLQLVKLHNHWMNAVEREYRLSRMLSLPHLLQLITSSPCNYGTKSCRKLRTP